MWRAVAIRRFSSVGDPPPHPQMEIAVQAVNCLTEQVGKLEQKVNCLSMLLRDYQQRVVELGEQQIEWQAQVERLRAEKQCLQIERHQLIADGYAFFRCWEEYRAAGQYLRCAGISVVCGLGTPLTSRLIVASGALFSADPSSPPSLIEMLRVTCRISQITGSLLATVRYIRRCFVALSLFPEVERRFFDLVHRIVHVNRIVFYTCTPGEQSALLAANGLPEEPTPCSLHRFVRWFGIAKPRSH